MSLVLDEHREYLSDKLRLDLFRKAIHAVVKPGDVVLDLGAGTGIMGLFACEAGARRVYSIDGGGMIQVARDVARANGFEGRLIGINGFSQRVELTEKADVLVADQIGHFGIEAGVLEFFRDAKRRLLKPNGRNIPVRLDLFVAPISAPTLRRNIDFWKTRPGGFDFSSALTTASNTGYPSPLKAVNFLGAPAPFISLDPVAAPPTFSAETVATIKTDGVMHGIGGFFSAELAPGIVMTNSPLAKARINRRMVFFPIERPLKVAKGDKIQVAMTITPANKLVTWKVELRDCKGVGKGRFVHSTAKGYLVSIEDLEKTRPDFVPRLSPWGVARRSVVDLCDGVRTISDIEREVLSRHSGLFPSLAEAAEFVAEVTLGYAIPSNNGHS
ncbi:MAG: 50S ribosomal protein L11 methyltransferase [Candidatus Binataceae bacterium]